MKSKDQELLAEAYGKVLKENISGYEGNIADSLHNLLSSIDSEAKTKSGASVRETLHDIIMELGEAVDVASRDVDREPWQVLQTLLSKLRLD